MEKNLVADEKIQLVINGFEKFQRHMIEKGNFDCDEFKNFMNQIFSQADYHKNNIRGGG